MLAECRLRSRRLGMILRLRLSRVLLRRGEVRIPWWDTQYHNHEEIRLLFSEPQAHGVVSRVSVSSNKRQVFVSVKVESRDILRRKSKSLNDLISPTQNRR